MKIGNKTYFSSKRYKEEDDEHTMFFILLVSSSNLCFEYFHRNTGPAVIYKNTNNKSWRKRGKYHRNNGSTHIRINKKKSWGIEGKLSSEEEYWNI